jgi:uncharacterized protein YutE (UPF0331/DUF86 family)/predicted nucleotidyltransferase
MKIAKEIKLLKNYFLEKEEVSMAFLFGSFAKGQQMQESDLDIGVYFKPEKLPKEVKKRFELEDKIRSDVSKLVEESVDLVCLNIAPASLVSNVFKTGIPLVIKDKGLYWEVFLKNSLEAEDFFYFLKDFWKIKYHRAKSLIEEDREKLVIRIDFLKTQMEELERFQKLSWEEYLNDKDKRRIIERWVEQIINALIDISKIVLASEQKMMPKSYQYALRDFGFLVGLNEEETEKFSNFADLRNILAHEYLDILYKRIQNLLQEFPPLYQKISQFLEKYLEK